MNNKLICIILILLLPATSFSQGLLDELEEQQDTIPEVMLTSATFKGTRIINGHSVELRKEGVLEFMISHRFGRLNSGAYELFGLDQASIRIGLEYALLDKLMIGIGRSSFEKTYDGFLKYRLLQQQSGSKNIPVSVTGFSSIAINTLRRPVDREISGKHRLDYTYQLLIARKFNDYLSLQLAPTLIHRNLTETAAMNNDLFALGFGGRMKLTKRMAITAEYFMRLSPEAELDAGYYDAIALAFEIETGGHVFQLNFTNAQAMIEEGFITETTGQFFKGDIHFGFNISRAFQLK